MRDLDLETERDLDLETERDRDLETERDFDLEIDRDLDLEYERDLDFCDLWEAAERDLDLETDLDLESTEPDPDLALDDSLLLGDMERDREFFGACNGDPVANGKTI